MERIFQTSRCWTWRVPLLCSRSSRIPNSRWRSASRSRKPKKRTGFYEEDRSPWWSTTTFEWLVFTLHDDKIQDFDTRWDEVLLSVSKFPSDDILESLQINNTSFWSTQKQYWNCKTWRFIRKYWFWAIKSWKPWWKRSIDQKLRLRNFDARHRRIETGAVVKSRTAFSDVEGGKGTCNQWKEKGPCSKGYQCIFRHWNPRSCPKKPEHTAFTTSESTVSRGRSASEEEKYPRQT